MNESGNIESENIINCPNCGRIIPAEKGKRRNHCPGCLAAVHAEEDGGCGGIMEPVSVWVKEGGNWEIIERCRLCGEMKLVELEAGDNPVKVLSVASKPLSMPPFPIEKMEELTRIMGGQGEIGGYDREQGE